MATPQHWGFNIPVSGMGDNDRPYITALADGRFVIAWSDNTNEVVRAQILNADGSPRSGSFLLSQNANSGAKEVPAICALSDGSFVAVWTEQTDPDSNTAQGGKADVVARIFKDGLPVGDEIQISQASNPTNYLFRPAITATGDGFAVSWSQYDSHPNSANNNVWIASYDSSGNFLDGKNFTTNNYEFPKPAITTLQDGHQVAVWVDEGANNATTIRAAIGSGDTFTQVDIATGSTGDLTTEFAVIDPQVTKLTGGGFVVTWKAENLLTDVTDDYKVMAQVFSATGQPVNNDPFQVYGGDFNLGTSPDPVVTALADGRFAVAWAERYENTGLRDIVMQVFSATGVRDGSPLLLSPLDATNDEMPTISILEDGRIVVAWWHDATPGIMTQIVDPRETGINLSGNPLTNDDYIGTNFDDTIDGAAGHDLIRTAGGNDTVYGGDDNDTLDGGDGNDELYGQEGADSIAGGSGHDKLFGWNGNDILDSGEGNDELRGDLGSDTLYGGNGDDWIQGGANEPWDWNGQPQAADDATNYLDGGAGRDTLWGGAGIDILNGGSGADRMEGHAGNDVYYVDNAGDVVIEDANAGTDVVIALGSWTLGANVENLVLTTAAWGVGNELDNAITGSGGNDVLNGLGGADTMTGGAGDDVYYVDGSDTVIEQAGGFDTVVTDASYVDCSAYANVERVISTYTGPVTVVGNDQSNNLVGNAGSDNLSAGGGNDVIDGGAGADTMAGGAGNDVYYVDNAADQVIESVGNGYDTVYTGVSFALGGNEIEVLAASGSAGASLTGNAFANTIIGNAGGNIIKGGSGFDMLDGGAGDDRLYGEPGNDVLKGGDGRDVFVFDSKPGTSKTDRKVNFDKITDFKVGQDKIWLDNKYFNKLGKGSEMKPGKLNKAFFSLDKAKDGNDYLIYNKKTGVLSYDADGSGSKAAIEVAQLSKNLKMTCKDFFVI